MVRQVVLCDQPHMLEEVEEAGEAEVVEAEVEAGVGLGVAESDEAVRVAAGEREPSGPLGEMHFLPFPALRRWVPFDARSTGRRVDCPFHPAILPATSLATSASCVALSPSVHRPFYPPLQGR